jgi:putative PIN family toxin of toxin-antitoxin system
MTRSEPPGVRVVLDTQVLLRGAVAGNNSLTAKIFDAWLDARFDLLFSEATLNEIEGVLQRPEVLRKLRLTVIEARALVLLLHKRGQLVAPAVRIRRSRDPDDDKFLECAVAGQAVCLVTADRDLLSLQAVEGIPINRYPSLLEHADQRAARTTIPLSDPGVPSG